MRDAIASAHEKLYGEALAPSTAAPPRASRAEFESAPTLDARGLARMPSQEGAPASTPAAVTLPRNRPRRWIAVAVALAAVALAWTLWPSRPAPSPRPPAASVAPPLPACTNASCAAGGRLAVCRRGA